MLLLAHSTRHRLLSLNTLHITHTYCTVHNSRVAELSSDLLLCNRSDELHCSTFNRLANISGRSRHLGRSVVPEWDGDSDGAALGVTMAPIVCPVHLCGRLDLFAEDLGSRSLLCAPHVDRPRAAPSAAFEACVPSGAGGRPSGRPHSV